MAEVAYRSELVAAFGEANALAVGAAWHRNSMSGRSSLWSAADEQRPLVKVKGQSLL